VPKKSSTLPLFGANFIPITNPRSFCDYVHNEPSISSPTAATSSGSARNSRFTQFSNQSYSSIRSLPRLQRTFRPSQALGPTHQPILPFHLSVLGVSLLVILSKIARLIFTANFVSIMGILISLVSLLVTRKLSTALNARRM
jgi:hypothetical protein